MSAANDCNCACTTPEIVQIPGSPGTNGTPGAAGAPGQPAYTLTTSDIILPVAPGPVVGVTGFASTIWMAVGQIIFVSDGVDWGHFRVLTIPTPASATLQWLKYGGDSAPTSNIGAGAKAVASGTQPPFPVALPAAVDYTALTAAGAVDNLAIAAGVGRYKLIIPFTFVAGVVVGEVLTNYLIGHKFRIVDWTFVAAVAVTGGPRVFNMEIDATDIGTVPSTLTMVATPIGGIIAGTTVAGANLGTNVQSFSIELQAGGTALTAGSGAFIVTVQNTEVADAVANLADHVNDLIASLT